MANPAKMARGPRYVHSRIWSSVPQARGPACAKVAGTGGRCCGCWYCHGAICRSCARYSGEPKRGERQTGSHEHRRGNGCDLCRTWVCRAFGARAILFVAVCWDHSTCVGAATARWAQQRANTAGLSVDVYWPQTMKTLIASQRCWPSVGQKY